MDADSKLRPRLSRQTIIFTCGPALTFKSTIVKAIGRELEISALHTGKHKSVMTKRKVDPKKRKRRYERLLRDAALCLSRGESVALDGTFSTREWRTNVYALARLFHARVVIIATVCDDVALLEERGSKRANDPNASDPDVRSIAEFGCAIDQLKAEPLRDDSEFHEFRPAVIAVDAGRAPSVQPLELDDPELEAIHACVAAVVHSDASETL